MTTFRKQFFAVAALLVATGSSAKDLYVDAVRGNDGVGYVANSASSPWRTIGRATWGSTSRSAPNQSEAARAGDVVHVSGPLFSVAATNSRLEPAYNPANSGTADRPIEFRAVGRVELRQEGGSGPVIGTNGRDYIRWIGFVIDENFAAVHRDTGPIVIWDSQGVVIDGCEVLGITQTYGDNHNGVRIEASRNSVVRNCRITGIRGTNTSEHNNAGIMLYGSSGIVMENNYISNCGAGIFPKGADNYDITIRYNWLSGNQKGIRTSYAAQAVGSNKIYQNVVVNPAGSQTGTGIQVAENSHNWSVFNNTFINVANALWFRSAESITNLRHGNNLVYGGQTAVNAGEWSGVLPGNGHNLYFRNTNWAHEGVIHASLSSWQRAVPSDVNSSTADPRLRNITDDDFRLAADSPARSLGRDYLDLDRDGAVNDTVAVGAFVSGDEVIGPNPGSDGPIPAPPVDVVAE